jgi:hypothetical protein
MILRELFYRSQEANALSDNLGYSPRRDNDVMKRSDTRKTRLSLKQINELRKSSERHILEQEKELEFIESMYKPPPQPAA